MKFNASTTQRTKKPEFSSDALKEISLLYLEEALRKEQYEDCQALIRTAKRFGAGQSEISKVIAKCVGGIKQYARDEAEGPMKGRRRF